MRLTWAGITVLSLAVAIVTGCPPNGGRKKRSVSFSDINTQLANFMGNCEPLKDAAREAGFPSVQSAVDFVLRDTNWFEQVENEICARDMNVPECWIYAAEFLLQSDSILFQPTAECICLWSNTCYGGSGVPRAPERKKRQVPGGYHYRRPCDDEFRPRPLTREQKTFSSCIQNNAGRFIQRYPSLKRIEGKSITLLLRDHYSFCRTIPEFPFQQRNLFHLLYSEQLCPTTGRSASWRNDFVEVFRTVSRQNGPVGMTISQCDPNADTSVYGDWSRWSKCSVTCGGGVQVRRRSCTGSPCDKETFQRRECNSWPCPPDPCHPNPCKYNGRCLPLDDDDYVPSGNRKFKCVCRPGYRGQLCEIVLGDCKDAFDYCIPQWCTFYATNCKKTCGRC